MTTTYDLAEKLVDEYISEKDANKIINEAKRRGIDTSIADEFIDEFEAIASDLDITFLDFLGDILDVEFTYYSDAIEYLNEHNYWSGWNDVSDGMEFDNICQVAYMFAEHDFYDERGIDVVANIFYDRYF